MKELIVLSILLFITLLIGVSLTGLLVFVYNTYEPINTLTDNEEYMRNEVIKGKHRKDKTKIIYRNAKPGKDADFFLIEPFRSDEDLSKKLQTGQSGHKTDHQEDEVKILFVSDDTHTLE